MINQMSSVIFDRFFHPLAAMTNVSNRCRMVKNLKKDSCRVFSVFLKSDTNLFLFNMGFSYLATFDIQNLNEKVIFSVKNLLTYAKPIINGYLFKFANFYFLQMGLQNGCRDEEEPTRSGNRCGLPSAIKKIRVAFKSPHTITSGLLSHSGNPVLTRYHSYYKVIDRLYFLWIKKYDR